MAYSKNIPYVRVPFSSLVPMFYLDSGVTAFLVQISKDYIGKSCYHHLLYWFQTRAEKIIFLALGICTASLAEFEDSHFVKSWVDFSHSYLVIHPR